jgi:hypothetical protein
MTAWQDVTNESTYVRARNAPPTADRQDCAAGTEVERAHQVRSGQR